MSTILRSLDCTAVASVCACPVTTEVAAGALVTSLVRSADVWVMAGVHVTDYTSVGHAMHAPPTARLIEVFPRYVRVAGQTYHRGTHHSPGANRIACTRPIEVRIASDE